MMQTAILIVILTCYTNCYTNSYTNIYYLLYFTCVTACCSYHCIDFHEWLLSEEIDLLSTLLLPLAGPEEFDEDVMDKLPDDLQYLPEDKEREPDPDIRKMLLESLMQVSTDIHV